MGHVKMITGLLNYRHGHYFFIPGKRYLKATNLREVNQERKFNELKQTSFNKKNVLYINIILQLINLSLVNRKREKRISHFINFVNYEKDVNKQAIYLKNEVMSKDHYFSFF